LPLSRRNTSYHGQYYDVDIELLEAALDLVSYKGRPIALTCSWSWSVYTFPSLASWEASPL